MEYDRFRMFRRQSLFTFITLGIVFSIIYGLGSTAGAVLLQGWQLLMIVSVYIFATRTFRLTGDTFFLFLGAAVPGIIVTKVFEVLSMKEFGLVPDFHDAVAEQFRNGTRIFVMGILVLAPWFSRIRIHRYFWTALSLTIGGLGSAVLLFTDWVPTCMHAGTEGTCGKLFVDLGICLGFVLAGVEMVWTMGPTSRVTGARLGAEKLRIMLVVTGLFLLSSIISILHHERSSWLAHAETLVAVAAWWLILEVLVYRGLTIPIRMINRSRSQLEAAIAAAVEGVLVNDDSGSVIAMNMRFRIFCGIGIDFGRDSHVSVLLGKAMRNAVNPEFLRQRTESLLESPGAEGFERFETKDGRIIEMSSVPYLFEGRIDGRVWTFRDVSARERTTAQLERSNWRLDNILTSARQGIFELNLETGTLWFHDNWRHLVGCTAQEVPSTWEQWKRMIHPDDVAVLQREMGRPRGGEREYRAEFRMKNNAGVWRWFLSIGSVGRIDSGEGQSWILNGVVRDVTADRVREAEIRRQRGMMEALIENMPLGAFVKEVQSRSYVIWNSPMARLSGYVPGQVIGRTDSEIFGPEIAARIKRSDDEVISQGVSVVIENSWIGETTGRHVRIRMVPVIDSDRTVTLIIGISEDVTQQQQIERLMHQTRSMEALGRLAGGIAHDFNNILQVIIGSADALKLSGCVPGSAGDEVDQILDAGDRAMALIRQLLTFSRQDSPSREAVDIGKVISALLRMLHRLIGADVAVKVDAPEGQYFVFAEKSRIEQVVMNLTVNAVDAMPYGGTLSIRAGAADTDDPALASHPRATSGGYVLVSVSDTGIGIPGDVLDHVWEPFFSTKEVGKGTGLGLSTVYGIVESLGGFIKVESELGKGSEFKIFLPMHVVEPDGASTAEPVHHVQIRAPESQLILVAHTDPAANEADVDALKAAGYRAVSAASGPEALQRLWDADESGGVAAMVLDVVMGDVGGRDICDRYRLDHIETPVIFVQGQSSPVIEQEYLDEVRGRVLSAPYTPRQFILEIRAVLGIRRES